MRNHCRRLSVSMSEATTWGVVRRRWLTVHLAERIGSITLRSGLRLESVLCARDLVALDLNGLLCFE